jgi:hypothetical protein
MPWVEFTENFNWTHARERRVTTAYKAGHRVLITTACAKAAEGRFVRIRAPRRGEKPTGEPVGRPVNPGGGDG